MSVVRRRQVLVAGLVGAGLLSGGGALLRWHAGRHGGAATDDRAAAVVARAQERARRDAAVARSTATSVDVAVQAQRTAAGSAARARRLYDEVFAAQRTTWAVL